MVKENKNIKRKDEIIKKDFIYKENEKQRSEYIYIKIFKSLSIKNQKIYDYHYKCKTFKGIKSKKIFNKKKFNYLNENMLLKLFFIYINNINNILLIYFFLIFFSSFLSHSVERRIMNSLSEISLKIRGRGDQYVLNENFRPNPDQIIINDIIQESTGTNIASNLGSGINNIKIIWNTDLTSCSSMFNGLENIVEIDLSNFDSSQVIKMDGMFSGCKKITSIDLTNFKTSSCTNMNSMFAVCELLTSLNLSGFDTSLVKNMGAMFYDCKSITQLDLSKFKTSLVTKMNSMFRDCVNLNSIDLTSFDTSSVDNMNIMFYYCSSLTTLNLSNFNTTLVTNMNGMFSACSNLISLDLSNFITSKVTNMGFMFYACNKLESLNINNFETSSVSNMEEMFGYCYVLKSLNLQNFNTELVTKTTDMFLSCKSLKFLDLSSFRTSSLLNMENMFKDCNSLISLNINNFDLSSVVTMSSIFNGCNSLISLDLRVFNNFNSDTTTNYENIFLNCHDSLRYCFTNTDIDQINNQLSGFSSNNCLDDCFINLENKFIIERRECIDDCSHDDYYQYEYESICYHACPEGTHQSKQNNYLCKDDFTCEHYYNYEYTGCIDTIPTGYYLDNPELQTIEKCDIKCAECNLESTTNNLCISCNNDENYYSKYNDNSNIGTYINCYNEGFEGYYLDNVEKMYKPCYSRCKNCYDSGDENNNKCTECLSSYILLINGNCYMANEYKDIEYFVNQYVNLNNIADLNYYYYDINSVRDELKSKYNFTYIIFSQDTKKNLINKYKLDEEKHKIYILIVEPPNNNKNSININYNYKLILENGTFLNLNNIKEDLYINVSVPINELSLPNFNYCLYFAEQGYDIYDKKGSFYNDLCAPAYLYENDLILTDRKNDIYPNNATLCKDNCQYKSVNIEEKRIICECNLNMDANYTNEEDDFLKEEDDGNFISYLLDYINYKILKCYNLLITFKNLKNNYAFYIIISIFIINIILYLIFCLYEIFSIRKITIKYFPNEQKIYEETMTEMKRLKSINIRTNSKKIASKRHTSKTINQKNDKKETTETRKKTYITSRVEIYDYSENRNEINDTNIKEKDDQTKEGNLNELPFTLAIQKDNRSAPQIFVSILIEKIEFVHLIIGNHNIKVILIFEYILSSLIDFLINTLLYSDDIVSQKYHNNGKLDFVVTLLLSILSNIITSFICNILSFSDGIEEILEEIIQIKKENAYLFAVNKFMKILKVKVFLSFVIQILFISFFFYYVVIFCIVYNHSQKSLLTNYSSSLVESLITSVTISVIVAVIRKIGIICLSNKLYNTSKFINSRF